MMQKEFEELTGVIVSNSEYTSIEREYMSCEDEKRIFCKKWVKNGGAAMLAKNRLAEIERLNAQVLALKNEVSALREKLDKAQKWNLVVDSKKTQTEYEEIEKDALSGIGRFLTNEEAIQVIADETGFDKDKIIIRHSVSAYEVSNSGETRNTKQIPREPIYVSSDYMYIRFAVKCGAWSDKMWRNFFLKQFVEKWQKKWDCG